MIEIDIQVPVGPHTHSVPEIVEQAVAAEALTVTMRSTLAQYPGSVHWHLKRGKERGTLEVTWWPNRSRLWLKVASGRSAEWIHGTACRLKFQIESDRQSCQLEKTP